MEPTRRQMLAGTLALIGGTASGCGRTSRIGEPLVAWSMWRGQEEEFFDHTLRAYERDTPGARIRNLGGVSDDARTVRALVAGTPPDFCTLAEPAMLGPLAASGALSPLDDLFHEAGLNEADFVPASLSMSRYQGRLYAIPFLLDAMALFWNKADFADAGLDPERPPRTLEELSHFATQLTKRDADGRLVRIGLRLPSDPYPVVAAWGGNLAESGLPTPDHPDCVRALTWYAELVQGMGGMTAVTAFSAGFGQDQGGNNPFFVGKVAMMISGQWNTYWLSRYAPRVHYGLAPMPRPAARPDLDRPTWLGGNLFVIPRESRRAAEAWRFLRWAQTLRAQSIFAREMNGVPNIRAARKLPELRSGPPFRRRWAEFMGYADSPNGAHFPVLPQAGRYRDDMSNALDRILYNAVDPRQVLAEVRARLTG